MIDINKVYCEDCVETMQRMDANSIDLTVTSPPYGEIRDYNGYSFDFESIAKELWRVTAVGGVVVWVVGDETIDGSESGESFKQALYFKECGFRIHDTMIYEKNGSSFPARRSGNRYSQIFEYMFVLSKGKPKTAHLLCDKPNRWVGYTSFGESKIRNKEGELIHRDMKPVPEFSPRNNIWRYNTGKNYSTKDVVAYGHPAIFPELLVQDHILTWSNPGDLVYDPMMGSGTVAKMCILNNRNWVGSEVSEEYVNIIHTRIRELKFVDGTKDIQLPVVEGTMGNTESDIPSGYSLAQNYPNPFNGGSTIEFSTKSGYVTIDVYNINGQKAQTILNKHLSGGVYRVELAELPSGVYFYRMSVNGTTITKKMVVLK
jgi:site-specific DNA-methyltransferase (adenine-specific)